jgi:lysophospholipase L1-like esterase
MNVLCRSGLIALALAALVAPAAAASSSPRVEWVTTWATAPHELGALAAFRPASGGLENQTVRNIVHTSAGGRALRVRLTNRYGRAPVTFEAARLGLQLSGAALVPGSTRTLTFSGRTRVTIPDRAAVISDPIRLTVPPGSNVAISLFSAGRTPPPTAHYRGLQTTYLATGDASASEGSEAFSTTFLSWYFIDEVDVLPSGRVRGGIVGMGDSITDGEGTTPNANNRWLDVLARLFDGRFGVGNAGIIGNNIHESSSCFGENALARLERDVLSRAGVSDVILLEGINDIIMPAAPEPRFECFTGIPISAEGLIENYQQFTARVRAAGRRIHVGTLTPAAGFPGFTPAMEATRQEVNRWIRKSRGFDASIDFDAAVRDPQDPSRLAAPYDSGDHLHPNDAGAAAMARAAYRALRQLRFGHRTRHRAGVARPHRVIRR